MTSQTVAPARPRTIPAALRRYPITAVAGTIGLVRMITATALQPSALDNIFMDDAFYYFGVAKHLAAGMGSTFGGVDPTNGYHPLWMLVTWLLFSITSGRAALITVVVVQCALVVATAASMDRIRQRVGTQGPAFVVAALISLFFLAALGTGISVSGMETGLVVLFLTLIGELWVRTDGLASTDLRWTPYWLFGALAAATVLSRLDAGVVVAVLYIAVAVGSLRRRDTAALIRLTVTASLPAAILGAYLLMNQVLFGSAMPISGMAKSLGAGGDLSTFVEYLLGPGVLGKPTGAGAISLILAGIAVFAPGVPTAVRTAARFGALLALSGAFLGLFYAVLSSWGLWPWYLYSAPLSLAFTIPALVASLRVPRRAMRSVAILASVALIAATALWAQLSGSESRGQPWVLKAGAVAELVDKLPPGTVAMGDRAGAFGFHLHKPLVQLEGLVESPAYLHALQAGKLGSYLNARDVRWYVRQDTDPGRVIPGVPAGCRGFTEPAMGRGPKATVVACQGDLVAQVQLFDNTTYRVWKYRPALNP